MSNDWKNFLKRVLPTPLLQFLRYYLDLVRWLAKQVDLSLILLSGSPRPEEIKVSFGHPHMPGEGEIVSGGMVKIISLHRVFPHASRGFNILYLGSSSLPEDLSKILWIAQKRKARIVLNQNGVGYPAWAGEDWQRVNHPMQLVMQKADYVFYQSEFCKKSADRFLCKGPEAWEVLYNPVDTNYFRPSSNGQNGLVLLSTGTTMNFYRFECAVRTLAELDRRGVNAKLIVAGRLTWNDDHAKIMYDVHSLINVLGVSDKVELLPPYSRGIAPAIYQRAHLLLHTKVFDPCPMVVLEAMASGLPVVYANSGGVPELVGGEAGLGVSDMTDYEHLVPPDPESLAEAVLKVAGDLRQYSQAARARAEERFDLQQWVRRHREVFERLLS